MISIKEEIAVPSPPERVWEVISNPSDVVSCISGAELGAEHDDGSFDGALVVKFGAIRVRFAARIRLELDEAEFEGRLTATGGDGQGATRFRGDATFRVVEDEAAGGTRVVMNGEVTLSGKLASLVESGATVVTSRMTKDFSAKLVKRCTEPAVLVGAPGEEAAVPVAVPAGDSPAAAAAAAHAPAAAPPRTGRLGRLRAWFARLLRRRQPPPPAPDSGTPDVPSPRTTQTEEVGSAHTQAQ
ncbi:SRPBCC family protein [Streptomyces sp. CA-111067]|uniref:SRPBCC family protein n=1 Tax=Streptomyces sp. CA-111067 TaxID=3240046 RepID=UPI003D972914